MTRIFGFFDARVPLFILFLVMLSISQKIPKLPNMKRLFLILLAFNPATLGYFIEGRDDIFMYAFLLIGLFFLYRNRFGWSSVFTAFAFVIKQSAWPIFPFYFLYIFIIEKNINKVLKTLILFSIIVSIVVLPFFFWNQKAFIDSTVLYLSGNTFHSYPIAGYGFGALLHQIGVIKDTHSYYPFWIWQIIVCLPLLIYLLLWEKSHTTVETVILTYGLFLFVFWYFSRYFNNSHVGFLSMVFITAYFFQKEEQTNKTD
jgi:hypothetical protein